MQTKGIALLLFISFPLLISAQNLTDDYYDDNERKEFSNRANFAAFSGNTGQQNTFMKNFRNLPKENSNPSVDDSSDWNWFFRPGNAKNIKIFLFMAGIAAVIVAIFALFAVLKFRKVVKERRRLSRRKSSVFEHRKSAFTPRPPSIMIPKVQEKAKDEVIYAEILLDPVSYTHEESKQDLDRKPEGIYAELDFSMARK